jgi:hypothetical protein
MKKTLSTNEAAHLLMQDEYAAWTWDGALALAAYLEELEESCGMTLKFGRVAIRCNYSEHESLKHWASDYWGGDELAADALGLSLSMSGEPEETDEEIDDAIRDYIADHGHLIEFDGGIIVSSF